jgi:hypothetical protein
MIHRRGPRSIAEEKKAADGANATLQWNAKLSVSFIYEKRALILGDFAQKDQRNNRKMLAVRNTTFTPSSSSLCDTLRPSAVNSSSRHEPPRPHPPRFATVFFLYASTPGWP